MVKPGDRNNLAAYLVEAFTVSTTRACKIVGLPKPMYYYESVKSDQSIIDKINEMVSMWVNQKAGQDKLYERIRTEGIRLKYKRVHRVYLAMGRKYWQRSRRRVPKCDKQPLVVPLGRTLSWLMEFMYDTLINERRLHVMNIIDNYNRQALFMDGYCSFPSESVIRQLERAIHKYGKTQSVGVDKGPEFT